MAGSLKYFVYQTDRGDFFALKADESNVEAAHSGTDVDIDLKVTDDLVYEVPRNVTVRKARFSNANESRSLSIPMMTLAKANELGPTTTIVDPLANADTPPELTTLFFRGLTPETTRVPKPQDTGLNDGDLT
jgi:hypothetical protein